MASQQRRRRSLPNSFAKCDRDSISYGDSATSIGYTYRDGNSHSDDASRNAYAYGNRDGDKHSACSANAKAAAHAVSSAYAAVIG